MTLTLHSVPWLLIALGALCGTTGKWPGAAWPLVLAGATIGFFITVLAP